MPGAPTNSASPPDSWREIVRDCLTRTHEERITGEALLRRVEAVAVAGADSCPASSPASPPGSHTGDSDFDPALEDPANDEYGIARWTPSVLRWWMREDGTPSASVPEPPFPPAESVPAMGRYLCWIAPRLDPKLPGDRRVLISAAYRMSYKKVNEAVAVPPKIQPYADRVAHYLKEYTPPGKK